MCSSPLLLVVPGIVTFRHPSTSSGGSHLGCILKGRKVGRWWLGIWYLDDTKLKGTTTTTATKALLAVNMAEITFVSPTIFHVGIFMRRGKL